LQLQDGATAHDLLEAKSYSISLNILTDYSLANISAWKRLGEYVIRNKYL